MLMSGLIWSDSMDMTLLCFWFSKNLFPKSLDTLIRLARGHNEHDGFSWKRRSSRKFPKNLQSLTDLYTSVKPKRPSPVVGVLEASSAAVSTSPIPPAWPEWFQGKGYSVVFHVDLPILRPNAGNIYWWHTKIYKNTWCRKLNNMKSLTKSSVRILSFSGLLVTGRFTPSRRYLLEEPCEALLRPSSGGVQTPKGPLGRSMVQLFWGFLLTLRVQIPKKVGSWGAFRRLRLPS